MKGVFASGHIPYEIGDIVKIKETEEEKEILDMRMLIYVKDKKSEFEIKVEDCEWIDANRIEKIIKPNTENETTEKP